MLCFCLEFRKIRRRGRNSLFIEAMLLFQMAQAFFPRKLFVYNNYVEMNLPVQCWRLGMSFRQNKNFRGKKACAIWNNNIASINSEFLLRRLIFRNSKQKHNIKVLSFFRTIFIWDKKHAWKEMFAHVWMENVWTNLSISKRGKIHNKRQLVLQNKWILAG